MKPLKVKILGSGGAAKKHKAAFEKLPGLYEVTDGDADITDICTPPYMHFKQAHEAIQTGHVIVEKPICGSLLEADALKAAEYATGNFVCPVFQYRFAGHEPVWRPLPLIFDKDAGEDVCGTALVCDVRSYWHRDENYFNSWRGQWVAALGGCLTSHGIHIFDLIIQAIGRPDCVQTSLWPESIERQADCLFEWPHKKQCAFIEISTHRKDEASKCLNLGDSHTGYVNQFRLLHEALTNRTEMPVTLAQARQALEVLTACYYSAFKGDAVTLPIETTHPFYPGWTQHFARRQQHTESSPTISV